VYRYANADFKLIHNIRFADDDIMNEMLLVIATGRK